MSLVIHGILRPRLIIFACGPQLPPWRLGASRCSAFLSRASTSDSIAANRSVSKVSPVWLIADPKLPWLTGPERRTGFNAANDFRGVAMAAWRTAERSGKSQPSLSKSRAFDPALTEGHFRNCLRRPRRRAAFLVQLKWVQRANRGRDAGLPSVSFSQEREMHRKKRTHV